MTSEVSTSGGRSGRATVPSLFAGIAGGTWLLYGLSIALGLSVWGYFSTQLPPLFLPSPLLVARTMVAMLQSGELQAHALASLGRILAGWVLGSVVGVVIGLLLGRVLVVYKMFHGVIEYLRFVPPITLVTPFIIWFGVGEASKIVLIAWVSVFIVIVNTTAGALSVRAGAIRAAQCLGASDRQVLVHVALHETVPYIVTGVQIALSNAFMTIVAAEMLAAHSGLGFMIWDAQIYSTTERMFVSFVTLCALGFATDRLIRAISRRLFAHYKVV